MKKIYVMPLTATTTIELQQMIAASDLLKSKGDGFEQDLSTSPTTDAPSGNLSRRNVWDDEEEEEEVR